MLKQLKATLVRSFVGALALGWVFGQGILYFVSAVTAPIDRLVAEQISPSISISLASQIKGAVPALSMALGLLLAGYLLLRWLYYSAVPAAAQTPDVANQSTYAP